MPVLPLLHIYPQHDMRYAVVKFNVSMERVENILMLTEVIVGARYTRQLGVMLGHLFIFVRPMDSDENAYMDNEKRQSIPIVNSLSRRTTLVSDL
ncbi:hypothetical protein VNO77_36877 [Canavalia gladiata]|uniref:Uncharacterized protein n=1 Tax=Canavalia gladiata TaxID=3824 RepID=A0AAN9KAI8_CANGL